MGGAFAQRQLGGGIPHHPVALVVGRLLAPPTARHPLVCLLSYLNTVTQLSLSVDMRLCRRLPDYAQRPTSAGLSGHRPTNSWQPW